MMGDIGLIVIIGEKGKVFFVWFGYFSFSFVLLKFLISGGC